MSSINDTASVTSTSSRARKAKSISARISSLFTSKSSHISDYYIELDEPLRHYGPGDIIKGKVCLEVAKPLGITHIVVSLFGYLEVFKNHSRKASLRHNPVASGRGRRWNAEYYGDGFASLFEDEKTVVDAPTRLDPGPHKIPFELDFPSVLSLPTSIDFERGTVSYVVSATITRPVTIAPTTTCSRKVFYRESIDVGALSEPKPRVVTLEPVDRSIKIKRIRRIAGQVDGEQRDTPSQASDCSKADRSSQATRPRGTRRSSQSSNSKPTSPTSSISRLSSAARDSTVLSEPHSSHTDSSPRAEASPVPSVASRIIRISVKISKAGCLPGDIVPLEVTINHVKAVRSLNGVIVTLYRQARVDMHPNLPIYSAEPRSKKSEDYYPRSKTGLGGLSLSAAGSSQVWRKDLSQTFAPLYIDPRTMSAVVKTSVRVPDEAFPTMQNAPGGMMTFKYIVEVIIDVHGKLGNQINALSASDPTGRPSNIGAINPVGIADNRDNTVTAMGSHCMDTLSMRREKNAVAVSNDLVIGTKDSTKAQGKRPVDRFEQQASAGSEGDPQSASTNEFPPDAHTGQHYDGYDYDYHGNGYYGDNNGYAWDSGYYDDAGYYYEEPYYYGQSSNWASHSPHHNYPHPHSSSHGQYSVPLPPMTDESQLPEKERLRRAEARLLPSAPPSAPDPSATAASNSDFAPSAPFIPEESEPSQQQQHHHHQHHSQADATHPPPRSATPTAGSATHDSSLDDTPPARQLPVYSHTPPADGLLPSPPAPPQPLLPPPASAQDSDKLDSEQHRLLGLASAPEPASESGGAAAQVVGPGAPPEETVDGNAEGHAAPSHSDTLPRYER